MLPPDPEWELQKKERQLLTRKLGRPPTPDDYRDFRRQLDLELEKLRAEREKEKAEKQIFRGRKRIK